MPSKLLYIYEQRIPVPLREIVKSYFPPNEFELRAITYEDGLEAMSDALAWADLALLAPGRTIAKEVMVAGKNVKLMQLWSSGYDKFNTADARAIGIPVANNGGSNAVSVAEHTVLLMLACAKFLPDGYARTVNGCWQGNSHGIDMITLQNKALGLIGFGNIGRHVGQIANGLGMNIYYYDIARADSATEERLGAKFVPLDKLLTIADVISLHLHLNDETRGMIGEAEFARMRDNTTLINVSRSQLIERTSLCAALESGKLRAVGLDVYDKEPTEANDPLLTNPKVVCTPHTAGSTMDAYKTALSNSLLNFRKVIAGEKPNWIINGVK